VTNVLIVASNSLPASYFRKVRQELGGGPDLVIDALVWSPPREPVDDVVRCFEVIGPEEETGPDSAPSTDAWTELPTKPPITGLARIRAEVKPRVLRRVPRRVRAQLRRWKAQAASRTFWKRVRSSAAAHRLVRGADLVVVVDAGALRTGWHFSRRYPDRPVVFGLPAAAVNLMGGIPG
jgi:hypothetical protein